MIQLVYSIGIRTYDLLDIPCFCIIFHICFFKNGPIPASFSFIFVLFTSQINCKLKKRRCSAWDSNPGPQDGRRRHLFVVKLD